MLTRSLRLLTNIFGHLDTGWMMSNSNTSLAQILEKCRRNTSSQHIIRIAFSIADNSTGSEDFIAYTIISETLYNLTIAQRIFVNDKYLYFGSAAFGYLPGNHQIIHVGRKSCSFISCYGIQHEMSYELYTQPFDSGVWSLIFPVILTFIGMTWATNWLFENEGEQPTGIHVRASIFDIVIVSFSILFEISLLSVFKRAIPGYLSAIFRLWVAFFVVISNMCKDVFTSEVIKPFRRNPSWSYIYYLDQLGFKFLLPLKSVPEYEQWY
ncbi:putative prephenate dehydratase [Folsomia candida]|uniref:Putative prephenate dehydratase n=1 Tax=Folsomia candida TaxID=158441 RepID=A0A226DWH5_FOLCA|nr:putative prephenate dehydratase [Folsomia candida]